MSKQLKDAFPDPYCKECNEYYFSDVLVPGAVWYACMKVSETTGEPLRDVAKLFFKTLHEEHSDAKD